MKSLTLILAFTCFLCTCGRAQIISNELQRDLTSLAFIKSPTGFLIDSLTIRTSLDTLPYGFAFAGDTLVLDVLVFRSADELIVETFAQGHSFGPFHCWIDPPSANIHLSIAAGLTMVDSVSLSPMDRWYRSEVNKIQLSRNLEYTKRTLERAIRDSREVLMCASFIKTLQQMPNLTRPDISWLSNVIKSELGIVKRHPWFAPLMARQKLMQSSLPKKLGKYELSDQNGNPVEVSAPKDQFYILNFYDARLAACRQDHLELRETMRTDSVFTGVPVVSIAHGSYVDGWLNYVNEGDFPWPHYLEKTSSDKPGLYDNMAFFPTTTYVLINRQNKIEGLFDDIRQLAVAVILRKHMAKSP